MIGILRQNTIVIGFVLLMTVWMVMSTNADEKQFQNHQQKQSAASQLESPVVKPHIKRSVKEPTPLFYPVLTKRELKIEAALNTETECNFSETPLSQAIKSLADRHDITIFLLEEKMKESAIPMDDPVSLKVKGIALKHVLKLILEPIDLTYMVDRELLKITTRLDEQEIYQTRVYPVGDFGNSREVYIELISTICEHGSLGFYRVSLDFSRFLEIQGGGSGFFQVISDPNPPELSLRPHIHSHTDDGGSIVAVPLCESLVISQTYHVHTEIVKVLTQLRRARALD